MKGKTFLGTTVLLLVVLLAVAAPAFAGQQTGIIRAGNSIDYYVLNADVTGDYIITIQYARADGSYTPKNGIAGDPAEYGIPSFPEAEVDGVVHGDNGAEPYFDLDLFNLYVGDNPQVDTLTVTTAPSTYYIGVVGSIGSSPYRLTVLRGATSYIDTGAINVSSPSQKWAHGIDSDLYLPDTGDWFSGPQTWPGSLTYDGGGAVVGADVWANWDDYAYAASWTDNSELANNWAPLEPWPTPEQMTRYGIVNPDKGEWYMVCPERWTSNARPLTVPADYDPDAGWAYPKPGSIAATDALAWYTYSWPDAAKAQKPEYWWGGLGNASASRQSFNASADTAGEFTYDFIGDSVKMYYTTFPFGGQAAVTIDGASKGNVSFYSAGFGFKQEAPYTGLGAGPHQIKVKNTGVKPAGSSGYFVTIDRFDAKQYDADPNIITESNMSAYLDYQWGKLANGSASGGDFSASADLQAAAAFSFTGTSVTYKYVKWPYGGQAHVYIDGVDKGIVDQYATGFSFNQTTPFTNLGGNAGTLHTILIVNEGKKTTGSGGFFLTVDSFVTGAGEIQN